MPALSHRKEIRRVERNAKTRQHRQGQNGKSCHWYAFLEIATSFGNDCRWKTGSRKMTLCRKYACNWDRGHLGKEFRAVCLPLIFDGFDETDEIGLKYLQEAFQLQCKFC